MISVFNSLSDHELFQIYGSSVVNQLRKNPNRGSSGQDILVKNIPGIFRFVTLSLQIPDRVKLYSWKFHIIVTHTL